MNVELLTEHHLEFLSVKGGCAGSSESTLVKMPHCLKPHVATYFDAKHWNINERYIVLFTKFNFI